MALATMEGDPRHDERGPGIQARVTALLGVLDEDVRHIEAALLRLDLLRGLLIKRDEGALQKLLEEIHEESQAYAATECRRQELRRGLATALHLPESDVTLSGLLGRLSGPDRASVAERQTRLKVLIVRLRREHALTSRLILDCSRFNRSLLRAFFGPGSQMGTTYSPTGSAQSSAGTAFLNMQL